MQGRLDVGGVISACLGIYVDQAPVLMPAAAVVFVFTGILSTVLVDRQLGAARCVSLLIGLVARRRCSPAWSSSSSPTSRTAGATPAPASCCGRSRRCSGS